MSKTYTKEEFAKKWPMDEIPDCIRECAIAWSVPFNLFIEDTIKLARDMLEATEKHRREYAKQQCLLFGQHLIEQGGGYKGMDIRVLYDFFIEKQGKV